MRHATLLVVLFISAVHLVVVRAHEDVRRIIRDLGDPSERVRAQAALKLERMGSKGRAAFPALVRVAFQDKSAYVRGIADDVLRALHAEAFDDLAKALGHAKTSKQKEDILSFLFIVVAEPAFEGLDLVTHRIFVPVLLALMKDPDGEIRAWAFSALGNLRDPRSLKPLLAVMKTDPEEKRRLQAAWALSEFGSAGSEAVPILVRSIRQSVDEEVLNVSFASLMKIGEPSIPVLVELMKENRADLRRRSAARLGGLVSRGVLPARRLVPYLADKDLEVRKNIIRALGNYGSKEVAPALEALLAKDVVAVQIAVAEALLRLDAKGSTAIHTLTRIVVQNERAQNVGEAITLLLRYGERAKPAISVLTTMLKSPKWQRRAAQAIESIDPSQRPVVIEILVGQLKVKDISGRLLALTTLATFGRNARPAVGALLRILANLREDSKWRAEVADVLGQLSISSPSVIHGLLASMKDRAPEVRLECAGALIRLGIHTQESVDVLLNVLGSEKEVELRGRALDILRMAGHKGKRASATLLEIIAKDPDDTLQLRALWAVCETGREDPKVLKALAGLLAGPDGILAYWAAMSIPSLGLIAKEAVPDLARALKSPHAAVRLEAAKALGVIGPSATKAKPALEEALLDVEYEIRHTARDALQSIAKPKM